MIRQTPKRDAPVSLLSATVMMMRHVQEQSVDVYA